MKSPQARNENTFKGFSDRINAPKTQSKEKRNWNNTKPKTTTRKIESQIIKEAGNNYKDLKKIEALLRIHAQANSTNPEIYKGLYTINRIEKRSSEAMSWAKIWITYPPKNAEEAIMQARLANRLKDLSALKKITKSLIILDQEKASIPMQWCIKHLLIAEEWDEAYKNIKRLKKIKPNLEAIKPLEAMCVFETKRITQKEKIVRIKKLEIEKITTNNKQTAIIKQRALYEEGIDPQSLIPSIITEKVNRHGIGIERLLVPILMAKKQTQQAIEICEKILRINESANKLRQVYGDCLLRQGKWRTGFTEKSANPKISSIITKEEKISIYCDSTLGEALFYSRWLSHISKTSAKTVVYTQQPLLKLLKSNFQHIHFTSLKNSHYHHSQKHIPISELPLHIKGWETNKDIFEYKLTVEETIINHWKKLLTRKNGQALIAINWHGSALKSTSEVSNSDINLEYFSCLKRANNIKLISLQKGTGKKQLEECSFKQHFHEQQPRISKEDRLEHIAAIIANCDAVICDDSGPAHLASNLGKKQSSMPELIAAGSGNRIQSWNTILPSNTDQLFHPKLGEDDLARMGKTTM